MHDRRAYGLNIRSTIPLPELPPATGPPDLEVVEDEITRPPAELDSQGRGFWSDGDQACYVLRGAGAFLVSEGRRITIDPDPGTSDQAVRLPLLGPALGLALHQRGIFTLHASAVGVGGQAVAILGGIGWGKSTTAAALVSRGHNLIADDLVSIRDVDGQALVVPGFPQIKLWPDALEALGLASQDLPRIHPDLEKRALRVPDRFAAGALPLRRFYILAEGNRVDVAPISRLQSFEAVARCWYGARFGNDLFATLDLRRHFLSASRLAHHVHARYLRRAASLDSMELAELISDLIQEDLKRSDSQPSK